MTSQNMEKEPDVISEAPLALNRTAVAAPVKQEKVANAELYAAVHDAKLNKWSHNSFKLYFSIFVAFACSCANGYDGSLMTAILAMSHFQSTFNAGRNLNTSVIFSLYTVGSMVGAPFAATISDRYGRRKSMASGAVVIIIGMIIAATSHSVGQLVAGRFVLGLGISVMTVAAPAYAAEVSPPQWRGRLTGLYNCGWNGGAIPAAAVTYGTNFIDSDLSWQIPLILQAFACLVVLGTVWFIPESPRFLVMNNRHEEALEFLVKYHGNNDPDSPLVRLEYAEMMEGIAIDGSDKRWWDYRALWATKPLRWRLAQVAMISIFPAFSSGGLGYYNTLIYENLGITSPPQQLIYNLGSAILSGGCAVIGSACTDWMPRRKVLTIGTFLLACLLAVNAGLSAKIADEINAGVPVSQPFAAGGLAALYIYGVVFSFSITPLQSVVPTEALETTLRAKGLAFSGFTLGALGFINQFAAPIGLGTLGYKYIWIWVACGFVESVGWYLFCVESKGRTLEELAWIYDQPKPVQASKRKQIVLVRNDGTVTEKIVDEV